MFKRYNNIIGGIKMKCPSCGENHTVYKCEKCGDVRCQGSRCKKPTPSSGSLCQACKKGKF